MSISLLDPYRPRDSGIHRLDARLKVAATLAYIVVVNVTPIQAWPALLLYLLMILAIVLLARIAPQSVLGRSLVAIPFVLVAALGLPFIREGRAIAAIALPWGALEITDLGALRFANVM
ncbi:MAG: cobalt ECF transporter T component CbiQ, partial [Chloroflexota bacterium]